MFQPKISIFFPLILLQVSTPIDLPTMTFTSKQERPKPTTVTPPSAALKVLSTDHKVPMATNPALVSSSSAECLPVDDDDEELDQLLSLQKPVSDISGNQSISVADESSLPEKGECIQQASFKRSYFFSRTQRGSTVFWDVQFMAGTWIRGLIARSYVFSKHEATANSCLAKLCIKTVNKGGQLACSGSVKHLFFFFKKKRERKNVN